MVLKYQSRKPKKDGSLPEPIFFEPVNERISASTLDEARPLSGYWKCEPYADSWNMRYNPDHKLKPYQMPVGPRFNKYATHFTTMATSEEARAYYDFKKSPRLELYAVLMKKLGRGPDGKVEGVEYNISKRWEEGIDHHPKSIELYKRIEELDWKFGNDRFWFKSGGDGDNGEHLMYLLDIHFEELDKLSQA